MFSYGESDVDRLLRKFNLTELPEKDLETVKQIGYDLAGNKLIALGSTLTGNTVEAAKLGYLSALVQQNWIIINQQSRILSILESTNSSTVGTATPKSVTPNIPMPQGLDLSAVDVIQYLSAMGIRFVDDTGSGGMLWIAFNKSISEWIEKITVNGNKPKYTHGAGMLDGKPGWFVSA